MTPRAPGLGQLSPETSSRGPCGPCSLTAAGTGPSHPTRVSVPSPSRRHGKAGRSKPPGRKPKVQAPGPPAVRTRGRRRHRGAAGRSSEQVAQRGGAPALGTRTRSPGTGPWVPSGEAPAHRARPDRPGERRDCPRAREDRVCPGQASAAVSQPPSSRGRLLPTRGGGRGSPATPAGHTGPPTRAPFPRSPRSVREAPARDTEELVGRGAARSAGPGVTCRPRPSEEDVRLSRRRRVLCSGLQRFSVKKR